jgi:outer membrane protein, heavy metal efflux system
MKKNIILLAIIITASLCPKAFAQNKTSHTSEAALDLNELINEALAANPDIEASQKKRDALWEKPPQAKAWEDPRLEIGVRNVPADDADFTKIDMTMKEVALSQAIPIPGITSLREKIAIQEAKSADRMHEYTRLQITREVKKAYFELYLVNRHIGTAEKNKGLLSQFVEIAQAKYAVGKGMQQDVLKAQVELSEFIEKLIQFKQQKTTISAELNRLLARDDTAPLLGQPVLPEHKITQSETDLAEAAKAGNPGLLSLQEIIARNEADYKLAQKSYVPEIMLTGAYGQRENAHRSKASPAIVTNTDGTSNLVAVQQLNQDTKRSDVFSVGVGINVPIWFRSKQNKKVAETFHMIEQSKAEYRALANEIRFKIRDLTAKQARETELIELYEHGIIPQATQSLNSAIAGYQVGSVDFLTLLDSQVTLCNAELQMSTAQVHYQMNLADIETIVGKKMF